MRRSAAFYLHPDSSLSTSPAAETDSASTDAYDPADPVPATGGNLVMAGAYRPGVHDERDVESRDDVLVYTSEPLAWSLEITGRVSAKLFASTDGSSTDWVVRLCEVDEDGRSLSIVDGVRRVRHRERPRRRSRGRSLVDEHRDPGRSPPPSARHLEQLSPLGPQPQHR
jgi:putative CocE/NonD family hydrolase